jgi:hypothetical protein
MLHWREAGVSMKRLIRVIVGTMSGTAIVAVVVLATVWLTTRHSAVIVRRIGNASQYRIAARGGLLAVSVARWEPSQPNNEAATYDLHMGAKWPLPEEWLSAPRNALGVRRWAERVGSSVERVWIVPLWLLLLGVGPFLVFRLRRVGRPAGSGAIWRIFLRWVRVAPAVACGCVVFLWIHSLCYRGWEFYSWPINLFVEVHAPGALIVVTDGPEADASASRDGEGEWSGWVCRLFAHLSTHTQVGSNTPTPWKMFPGFGREAVYTTPIFVGERRRLTEYEWTVPFWAIFLLTAAYPAAQVVGAMRRRRRFGHGMCPDCGYDLRATPERCPECGRVGEHVKL